MVISGGVGKSLKVNKREVAKSGGMSMGSMGWAVINGCGEKTNICIG